jgi:hypothetical protein
MYTPVKVRRLVWERMNLLNVKNGDERLFNRFACHDHSPAYLKIFDLAVILQESFHRWNMSLKRYSHGISHGMNILVTSPGQTDNNGFFS